MRWVDPLILQDLAPWLIAAICIIIIINYYFRERVCERGWGRKREIEREKES